MATIKNNISKSLQETVSEHAHIKHVHFDAQGRHWLNVFEAKSKLHSGLYGHIKQQNVVGKDGQTILVETPTSHTKIVETISREDVLNSEAQSDLALNLNSLSPEEQKIIDKMRSKK